MPLECPACGHLPEGDERFCAECGMPLVLAGPASAEPAVSDTRERARKIRPELTRGPLVRIAGSRHQAEAELIQNILLEEGVPSIARRAAGFDVPDFLAAGPRDVLVPESGAEVARLTLAGAEIEVSPLAGAGALSGKHVVRLALAVVTAAALAALIAWALLQTV